MDSLVLTTEEIYELTHYRRAAEQMRALAAMGIPAYLRKHDNTVCVLRAVVTTAPDRLPTQPEPMPKSTRKRLGLEAAQVKEVAAPVRKSERLRLEVESREREQRARRSQKDDL